ncbi:DUF2749 domain-containing protein [Mesorhizobium sp. B2-4-1]|nr:DUF2749 domain-containing protein [Mesorhizobium sp. B2-4-8]TPL59296.1 DUF2749 domain-containing protein [Mesorhizobium sp. B2-4-1]
MALGLLFSFLAGSTLVWLWTATTKVPTASSPSSPARPSASDAKNHHHGEKFFGGDAERNIRNGQEMTPRW